MNNLFDQLIQAIEAGDAEQAEALIQNNPQLCEQSDDKYGTPLLRALNPASGGTNASLMTLLIETTEDINARNPADMTALHMAAYTGNLDAVKALVARGSDINATDIISSTPLFLAFAQQHTDIVSFLLAHGADPTIENSAAMSVYEIATMGGGGSCAQLLVEWGKQNMGTSD